MSTVTAPASAGEALAMARAGLGYLAAADATAMAAAEQARCLRGLEQAHAVATAARTSVLAGFGAGQGYCADGAYSPRAWLIHQAGITRGAAAGQVAWVRRSSRRWPGRRTRRSPRRPARPRPGGARRPGGPRRPARRRRRG